MKKLYFKVTHGYGLEDVIYVDNLQDLEKAIYAFGTGKNVRIGSNFIKGTEIKHIKEDWNRAMGYARGYKLQPEDWTEIQSSGVEKLYKGVIADIGQKVSQLMKQGMTAHIGVDRTALPEFKNLIELQ